METPDHEIAEAILRAMFRGDEWGSGYFDPDGGVVDVRCNFSEEQMAYLRRLEAEERVGPGGRAPRS